MKPTNGGTEEAVEQPKEVAVAIDILVSALLGAHKDKILKYIDLARRGEVKLIIFDFALPCAMYSIRDDDEIDFATFRELIRFSTILPIDPKSYPAEANPKNPAWRPTDDEIEHWRHVALSDDDEPPEPPPTPPTSMIQ